MSYGTPHYYRLKLDEALATIADQTKKIASTEAHRKDLKAEVERLNGLLTQHLLTDKTRTQDLQATITELTAEVLRQDYELGDADNKNDELRLLIKNQQATITEQAEYIKRLERSAWDALKRDSMKGVKGE